MKKFLKSITHEMLVEICPKLFAVILIFLNQLTLAITILLLSAAWDFCKSELYE